jgi:hypothetical protein
VVTLPAHLVATPVLGRLAAGLHGAEPEGPGDELEGVVLGVGATAAWVDLGGFVVAITTREVPLLPNAIALAAGSGALVRAGAGPDGTARLTSGRVTLGSLQVTWDPTAPPGWDPTVPVPAGVAPQAVGARGAALLGALGSRPGPGIEAAERAGATERAEAAPGVVDDHENRTWRSATLPLRGLEQPAGAGVRALVRELGRMGLVTAADPDGAAGLTLLFRAVRERDPEPAAAAARALLGRGPGLTPEGDDLLAAVAGTLAVLGPATRLDRPARDAPRHEPTRDPLLDAPTRTALLDSLGPIPGRTTALSVTLLGLASVRQLPEPAGRLLDLSPAGEVAWPAALARLERLGHGSGRAYAAGIAAAARLLAAP